jgi:uncharacterized membrane protein YvlD (DUF360 family)
LPPGARYVIVPVVVRLLVRIGLSVAATAVAFIVAASLLDGFEIDTVTFIVSVVIFSILSLILKPILTWVVAKWARPLLGVVALVTTFVILLITDLVSDGLQIEGAEAWILGTVIVWLGTVLYSVVDEWLLLKIVKPGPAKPA